MGGAGAVVGAGVGSVADSLQVAHVLNGSTCERCVTTEIVIPGTPGVLPKKFKVLANTSFEFTKIKHKRRRGGDETQCTENRYGRLAHGIDRRLRRFHL